MKKFVFVLASLCMVLSAQEKAADWAGPVREEDGSLIVEGKNNIFGKTFIVPEKQAVYRLSGEFRAADGTVPNQVLFGVMCFDKNRKLISDLHVNAVKGTDTELVETAPAGADRLKIRDGSKWKKNLRIMFGTKADRSDLPNRNILEGNCKRVFTRDAYFEVLLSAPLKQALPAGTGVRQTMPGGYYYAGGIFQTSMQWKKHQGMIRRFWPGTEAVRILILTNWDASKPGKSVLQFRNIKLEKLPQE